MSKISCDIIQDMLPLYYDEVCSADSRKMIEEHLQECEKCSNIFQKLKTECVVDTKENAESIQSSVMGKMAHSWKRSLLRTQPQCSGLPYPKSHTAALRGNGGTGA